MKIFLVAGRSGSGKGEVAKYINEYYVYKIKKCVVTEYSKYLKLFAKEMTDWDGVSVNKPRDFLQQFGSKIRAYDKFYFTKRMIEDINIYALDNVDIVIVSDVRMPEEIEEIRENYDDVTAIYVVNQFSKSTLTVAQQAHITENALSDYDDFDFIIANDNKDELRNKVFKILEDIEGNE